MPEVKVLVEGTHEMDANEQVNIGATTTLIKSNINIIVDPGSYVNKDKLVSALKKEGLETADIQAVILTHSHIDHTTNIFLFPQARIYNRFKHGDYKGQFQSINEGFVQRFDILHESIAEGVKIIETTGHSIDHISVVIETELGKVVVAGDALVKQSWVDTSKLPDKDLVYSIEEYQKSRENILTLADYIIPGHGAMFRVEK